MLLGEILIKYHLITPEQLEQALKEQHISGQRLGALLIKNKWVSEDDINFILSQQLDIPNVQLSSDMVDKILIKSIPWEILQRYEAIPLIRVNEQLTVVMSDPTDIEAISDLANISHCQIQPALGKSSAIRNVLKDIFGSINVGTRSLSILPKDNSARSGYINFLQEYIRDALELNASEIHFEPTSEYIRVRYRIDGQLVQKEKLPVHIYTVFLSKIKMLFQFDLSKSNQASSAMIFFEFENRSIQLEAILLPSYYGESVTIRIQLPTNAFRSLVELNIEVNLINKIKPVLQQRSGILLITGQSNLLRNQLGYALLNEIDINKHKIITIEKKIFIANEQYIQISTDMIQGLGLSEAFREAIQQNCDVLLIDLSDSEQLLDEIIRASLKEKLIIGLLPYRNISEIIACLQDLHIKPYLLASYLLGLIGTAQFSRLCDLCREKYTGSIQTGKKSKEKNEPICYRGKGCAHCHQLGYNGLYNIFEYLPIFPALRKEFRQKSDLDKILELAKNNGFIPLKESALQKVADGMINIDEIIEKLGE